MNGIFISSKFVTENLTEKMTRKRKFSGNGKKSCRPHKLPHLIRVSEVITVRLTRIFFAICLFLCKVFSARR